MRAPVWVAAALALACPPVFSQTEPPPPPEVPEQPEPAPEPAPPPEQGAPATAPPPPAPPAPGEFHRVVFRDGQLLRGRLVREDATEVVLELSGGGRLAIPRDLISAVELERGMIETKEGQLWFDDANRTRYFYSPSAMMLKKGQAYFSQKELVFSSFGYGVTDNFSILVGTVVPAWFFGLEGINGIVGLKAGAPIAGDFSMGAGLETLIIPAIGSTGSPVFAGLLFGTASYGNSNAHLSLSVGKPFAFSAGAQEVGDLITTLSGSRRVHQNVAVMSENWLFFPSIQRGEFLTLHAVGARIMGEKVAVDLGFIWAFSNQGLATAIPVPWVDFTYNFEL